ncbi:MAG: glycosyltransferase family 39 protein [Rhodospirillaceae bacterium]|nr:glycosyltransferase family 39 protein [Rhodospirillaceae bacterium]
MTPAEGVPAHPSAAEAREVALKWPLAVAGGIFAVLAIIILTTFQDYGISWDEQLQNTYGKKLLSYYVSGFQDRSAFSYINLFLYGGFFDLVAAVANLVSPFEEYETRHLMGGLVFLMGLWGGWRLARLLAGERAAIIALICLATTPLLYGHAFINPKDSPLAWLLIWVTYFSCRVLGTPGRPSWGVVAGFAVSLGLAVGTRVVGVVYIDYLIVVLGVAALARYLQGEPIAATARRMKFNAVFLGVGLVLAFVTMAVVWPWSVQQPLNIIAALRAFSHFAFYPQVLWNGELIRADDMPRTYLPGLLVLQLPEYVLLGVIAAAVAALAYWRRGLIAVFAEPRAQQYLFVTLTVVAPVAGYMVMHPTVYNGLRHFLFVVPPLVILGAIGLHKIIAFVFRKQRIAGVALSVALTLALARQVALMIGLHPYEYIAYNALIGGVRGAENRFELDYWGTSLAESARGLAAYIAKNPRPDLASHTPLKVFACGDRTSAGHFLPPGTELTETLDEADFYMGMTGVPCQDDFRQRPERTVFEVVRLGVTVGFVLDLRVPQQPAP